MLARLQRMLETAAAVDGAPQRTAAALALGVGLSFSPLLGLQVLLGLAAAFAFRLSRVAVLVGLCANVPWIMLPWYLITTAGAATVLGVTTNVDLDEHIARMLAVPVYRQAFWAHAGGLLEAFFWPFLLGPSIGAALLGTITYAVARPVLTRRATSRAAAPSVLPGDAEERAADRHVDDAERSRLGVQ
jgi:uncharacterized protein (DUF2062 family)